MNNPLMFMRHIMSNQQMINNNPVARNTMMMINNRDYKGLETLGRNLCKERGINPDEAIMSLRRNMKI